MGESNILKTKLLTILMKTIIFHLIQEETVN